MKVEYPIIDAHALLGEEYHLKLDADELIRRMNAHGVETAIARPMGAELAVFNREGNDRVLKAHKRIRGLVSANPWFGPKALDELKRCHDLGAIGLFLHPSRQGFMPTDDHVRPLLDFAGKADWPVMFHTGSYVQSDILAVGEVARKYPRLNFIAGWGGFTDMWFELPGIFAEVPNLYLDASMMWGNAILQIIRERGVERVLFGSAEPRNRYAVALGCLERAELTGEQLRAVLGELATDVSTAMKIIDFHTHLQTHWFETPLVTEAEFIAGMDRFGIETACIFTLMGFYGNCPAENDTLAAYAAKHPKRLIPFATVDAKLGPPAVEELERCLSNPVFRGVKFHNWLQAFAPSMARETMIEILRCAARHKVPVLFHDGTPPYSTTFQIAAMARWVPEATVVLGHGGLADYVYPAGQLLSDLPNLHVCFCGPKAGDLTYLVEAAGEDRVLFGSDFGFSDWRLLGDFLENVIGSGLPSRTLEKILHRNAERLLHLDERPL